MSVKLISKAQLKKSLQSLSPGELIELITDISEACQQAREFLTMRFPSSDNINEVLDKYKQKVEYEFFPKRGFGRLNLREAKKAVTDFRKMCPDKTLGIDIMLFYVENCVRFTDEYGDIHEAFYNSAISVYASVVTEINSGSADLYGVFAARLKAAAENACDGWGFQDDLMDLYHQISWVNDETDECYT
jgi:TusA-related sulfurtransferase